MQKDYQYDASDNLVAEILTQTQRQGGSRPTAAANDDSLIGRFHGHTSTGKSYQGSAAYGYNPVEQIQSMHRSSPASLGQHIESLNYDAAGNLFDGYRVNGLIKHNRVHVYRDKRYRYDRFGRLSEKRSGSLRIKRFEYDAEHRLIEVQQQNGALRQRVVFGYDPLGRRISKQVYHDDASEPSNRTLFHWQGLRLLEEVLDGRPSLYVYAEPGSYEPLARIDGKSGSEAVFYFHTNLAGLPEQLTDTDGHTVWHSEYQAWGRTRDEWHDQQPGREQNLRFQGQYLDRETGLHYNTFRFFDPDVGRFTQPDPIGLAGGLNLYQYAPNAIGWIDPAGLTSCELSSAMKRNGTIRPPNSAAHHIVPETAKGAKPARDVLHKHNIGINKEENGVFLPTNKNTNGTQGILHNGKHPNKYLDAINRRIVTADKIGGKQAVIDELQKIKNTLSSANRNASWYRSEEHTSELQSRLHLVCRLLLEKKKKKQQNKQKKQKKQEKKKKKDDNHNT